jgi:hypothetical protein
VRARTTAGRTAATRLIRLQRIQEFQQVIWPWSSPVRDFAARMSSSIRHLVADHRYEVGQAGGGGGVAAVKGQLAGVAVAAGEQDAVPGVMTGRGVVRVDLDHGSVVVAVALGAVAGPQSLPGRAGQPGQERVRERSAFLAVRGVRSQ